MSRTQKKQPPPRPPILRTDGFYQPFSGLGSIASDPTQTIEWNSPEPLSVQLLSEVYAASAVAAKIVDKAPHAAFRRGVILSPEAQAVIDSDEVRVIPTIRRGICMGRLYGGSAVVVGTSDPVSISEPAPPGPKQLLWLRVFERSEIAADGISKPFQAERLRITPIQGAPFTVHRSRVLFCRGATTTAQHSAHLGGWDSSYLQRPFRSLQLWEIAFSALCNMLVDANQSVLKIHGLLAALGANKAQVEERARLFQMGRSVCRALLLDSQYAEEYQKIATSFAGVPESIDRFAQKLALDADTPAQILFGEAPGGLNANGEPSIRSWDDDVAAWRTDEVDPLLRKFFRILGIETTIGWPSLRSTTDAEDAAARKATAETDAIYLDRQVYSPDQVAAVRARPRGWTLPIEADEPLAESFEDPNADLAEDEAEDVPTEAAAVSLAAHMTEQNAKACQHGRKQRCPVCGVEREARIVGATAEGAAVWGGAWRAL